MCARRQIDVDLREDLHKLESKGLIKTFDDEVSCEFEAASIIARYDGKYAVYLKNVRTLAGELWSVTANIATSRTNIATLLNTSINGLTAKVERGLKEKRDYILRDYSWDIHIENPDLRSLPILHHYDCEPSPYITSGVIFVKEHDTRLFSASFHRMMVIDRDKLAVRIVAGRRLLREFKRAESESKDLEIAAAIGLPMPLLLASATPTMEDKVKVAGGIAGEPIEMSGVKSVNAYAPSCSQIVLEGKLMAGERAEEGPFYEILGIDVVRRQPVFKVEAISMKRNPVYQAILPGGMEHSLLMGIPVEAAVIQAVRKHANVKAVATTPAGKGWLEVAISIEKESDDQPFLVGLSAIHAHKSIKSVIIVDSDVDVTNYLEVMNAVIQRANPSEDYLIIKNVRGSSLDHSNIRRIGGKFIETPRSKVIIDATIKGDPKLFKKPIIPVGAKDEKSHSMHGKDRHT